ncbi:hypothetical protein DYBT9275_05561 [Dyadobacter sp. CECT 9275]|uniref:Circularly permuted type 2 ATP-grasp protein n=1 Tax=Dyadobacter helix TaxID=2822344 RepID=A0A916JHT5_9BACT|nr:hypothetical protein [Dyadobacter sp. CECT 9275]CAG5016467.1 hypothetical protein DYBT9275_05561 [Dyadobacter sp. CECT 9275]
MHQEARKLFNESFTEAKYNQFVSAIENEYPGQLDFRIAESPVFIPEELRAKLTEACDEMMEVICAENFISKTSRAVPPGLCVPNENSHTSFLALDFAICRDDTGNLIPQLIELQGFPSIFGYQAYLSESFMRHFSIPDDFTYLFASADKEVYYQRLRELLLGTHRPEEVILLEIFPEKQKTRIDFAITEQQMGIKTICYTKVIREGRKLYYEDNNQKIQIKRIYNRLIFDDLHSYPGLKTSFNLTDDVEVEWVGHPNWFFRISKFTLPFLTGKYVPETKFLSDYHGEYPADLDQYVLKPLFSFAGTGVLLTVTPTILAALPDPENYILQKKVTYEPVIQSPDGLVKCEIRMMYGWPDKAPKPELLISLSRLSRGEMIGVRFNKEFTWVGSSACFYEQKRLLPDTTS